MTALDQNNNTNPMNDSDEISLKELIQNIKEWIGFLKTKWKLILVVSAIGAALGVTYAFISKPTYKAVMTFVLEEDKGGGMSGAMGLASSFGIDLGGAGGGMFTSSNILELMKSRRVVEKTLLNPITTNGKKLTLADFFINFNELKEDWMSEERYVNVTIPINTDRSKFTIQQDTVLQELYNDIIKNNLTITQKDKKVSIITIEVKSKNENFSKTFCELLAKETSEYYIETKSKKSRMNVEILQKQTDSIRGELNGAIAGVASAMDNVFNLNTALTTRAAPSKRRQVDVQANTAILTQLVAQLELAKVNLRKETPLIQIIDKPILPLKKEKLGRIKSFILGGFLAGLLTVLYLIFGRLYKKLIA